MKSGWPPRPVCEKSFIKFRFFLNDGFPNGHDDDIHVWGKPNLGMFKRKDIDQENFYCHKYVFGSWNIAWHTLFKRFLLFRTLHIYEYLKFCSRNIHFFVWIHMCISWFGFQNNVQRNKYISTSVFTCVFHVLDSKIMFKGINTFIRLYGELNIGKKVRWKAMLSFPDNFNLSQSDNVFNKTMFGGISLEAMFCWWNNV